jgi:hypothetical protein
MRNLSEVIVMGKGDGVPVAFVRDYGSHDGTSVLMATAFDDADEGRTNEEAAMSALGLTYGPFVRNVLQGYRADGGLIEVSNVDLVAADDLLPADAKGDEEGRVTTFALVTDLTFAEFLELVGDRKPTEGTLMAVDGEALKAISTQFGIPERFDEIYDPVSMAAPARLVYAFGEAVDVASGELVGAAA